MSWNLFFVCAGLSNLAQAWFFYFSNDPATSKEALLGVVNLQAGGDNWSALLASNNLPAPPPVTYSEDQLSKSDFATWLIVALSGLFYLWMGVTSSQSFASCSVFGGLKLAVFANLLLVWAVGEPKELCLPISLSELVWGTLFMTRAFVVPQEGGSKKKKKKKN
ncbi:hypothetical protein TeGR_g8304 [Tetraparma gracilis]|uniref:Uncharacterized protein n=1 Tax=Tetraparma gracilis TaxID=2962635 RepID=A0ABQ6NB23_9STRA|nr:hypothetical protein TeGR_g8304 [Tetraparma gracilis]